MLKTFTNFIIRLRLQVAVLAGVATLSCLPPTAQALNYNQISEVYFFGDSLTDSGFNDLWYSEGTGPSAPLPAIEYLSPNKNPTFTTWGGFTWAQYIAHDIKGYPFTGHYPTPAPADTMTNNSIYPVAGFVSATLNGTNYAAGGSTTGSTGFGEYWAPSLQQQVAHYLATAPQQLDPNAVYFIWSGANDLLSKIDSVPMPSQLQLLQAANTAANNIGAQVASLSARGAKRIVVLSLPNIGYTPFVHAYAAEYNMPTLPATLKTLTFTFNSMLNTQLGKVVARYGTKILYVDVFDLLDDVINTTKAGQSWVVQGRSFKLVNYTDPACSTVPSAIYCPEDAPNNYIFADSIHPSDMSHHILALQVEQLIQNWN